LEYNLLRLNRALAKQETREEVQTGNVLLLSCFQN